MELRIQDAVIEVTRKCNMKCEHCLRGAAQRKTIDDNHIYKFLQIIDDIGTLTITGGEPTLAMDSLEQIKHCAQYGNCDVGDFYMVTNGKAINVERLAEWANGMRFACHNNELSSIAFSFDQFHTQTFLWKQAEKQKRNFERLQRIMEEEYGLYDEGCGHFIRKHSDSSWGYQSLISEGRAEDFGAKENYLPIFEEYDYCMDDDICFSETELYLSSNGIIVAGCNWSYHSIDNRKDIRICHIDDIYSTDDLIEAIRAYNKKMEKVKQYA
jgi:MoaA/NifB/PqqE/SkfB family radical SAM enzyme